jgi:hypothetical protein
MKLKDLILAIVFHNLDKFRKQFKQINAKFGPQIAQWSAELGVPIDLDRFEQIFESNIVQKIASLHAGAGEGEGETGGTAQDGSMNQMMVMGGSTDGSSASAAPAAATMTAAQLQQMAHQYATSFMQNTTAAATASAPLAVKKNQ